MYDPSTNFLIVHEWAYGLTEVAHILSLGLAIGSIAVVDLRLLGVAVAGATPARLVRATLMGVVVGLVVAVTSGLLILSTDPVRYFAHPAMRLKLILLLAALVFHFTIHNRVALGSYPRALGPTVAVVSLVLWVSIVFSGVFYAFT